MQILLSFGFSFTFTSIPCDLKLCCKCWDFWCWYRIVYYYNRTEFFAKKKYILSRCGCAKCCRHSLPLAIINLKGGKWIQKREKNRFVAKLCYAGWKKNRFPLLFHSIFIFCFLWFEIREKQHTANKMIYIKLLLL